MVYKSHDIHDTMITIYQTDVYILYYISFHMHIWCIILCFGVFNVSGFLMAGQGKDTTNGGKCVTWCGLPADLALHIGNATQISINTSQGSSLNTP